MLSKRTLSLVLIFISFLGTTLAGTIHTINFKAPNLYPESLAWEPKSQHFIIGSLSHRKFLSVSESGVAETIISDPYLPANSVILGIIVDTYHHRLLAAIHSPPPLPPFNAVAVYDLHSRSRLFLAHLFEDPFSNASSNVANDVTVDHSGAAYVTNSGANFIWKVTLDGQVSILSRSALFTSYPVDRNASYDYCGINGVVYISKGYLLTVQSNTGMLFKVNVDDGTAIAVILNKKLVAGDGIAVRSDGVVLVVSQYSIYFIKSDDSWGQGTVFDEIALNVDGFATSVAVGNEDRVFVLYGHVEEGIKGKTQTEEFSILELESEKEQGREESIVWILVLIGLGLAYFLFWRFQMRQLVIRTSKKIS